MKCYFVSQTGDNYQSIRDLHSEIELANGQIKRNGENKE